MSEQERMDGPELVPELVRDLKLAEFELQLARAMRPVDAPEGFAARVVARAAGGDAAPPRSQKRDPGHPECWYSRSGVGCGECRLGRAERLPAVLALGMYGAEVLHQRRERAAQAAKADQQFAVAMQVTDHALAQTREQLQRAGLKLGE